MNNLMPSSPSSQASSSNAVTDTFIPPDEIINETLVSLFYLTSEGGFISKVLRPINHREKDGKIQIEVIISGYTFWMDAKDISLRLNQMQHNRLLSDRSMYFISESNGKFRCNHRIKSWSDMRLEQYQEMSRGVYL
ncbi:hypothetical protein [Citrobacter sp.]|uniref:hypothetical protein n=1 Tax=Citrobacter sp. TaxID=1896336 RepID=UPI002FC80B2F